MIEKRFVLGYNKIKDKEDNVIYGLTSLDNQDFGLHKFIEKSNELDKENKEKTALIKAKNNLLDDYKYQIRTAYNEGLTVKELADKLGIDLDGRI